MHKALIDEIFSSVQGEGILAGQRHIFVRFHGCSLRCSFCDTPSSLGPPGFCSVEKTPGRKEMSLVQNPVTPERLTRTVLRLKRSHTNLHTTLALTGGEPLEQADFLAEWLPEAQKHFRVYLETNGVLPDRLRQIVRYIDTIGMDIKLPSSAGQRGFWDEHERFLKVAAKKDIFVKIVMTPDTDRYELLKAGLLISKAGRHIPTVLQPVTPWGAVLTPPTPVQLMEGQEAMAEFLDDVRVIPQLHRLCSFL